MTIQRWYEKNPDLNELFTFIQGLSPKNQKFVMQHLLQILFFECKIDLDKEFSKFSENDYSYNRWYDSQIDTLTAFELIKTLSEETQNYVIERVVAEVIIAYSKMENKV